MSDFIVERLKARGLDAVRRGRRYIVNGVQVSRSVLRSAIARTLPAADVPRIMELWDEPRPKSGAVVGVTDAQLSEVMRLFHLNRETAILTAINMQRDAKLTAKFARIMEA